MGGYEDNLPVVGYSPGPPSLVASSQSSLSEDRYGEKGLRPIWTGTIWTDTEVTEDTSDEDSQDSYGSSEYSGEEHLYESVDPPVAVGGNDIITIMEGEPTCHNDGHEWSKTFCLRCGLEYGRIPCSNSKVVGSAGTRPNVLAAANITTLVINMILILVLIILPCVGGTALNAYDCQQPSQVERRQRPSASWCFSSSRQPADTKVESQWTLLQRVSSFEIQGFRCSVYRSRSVYRCGMFSHVSLIRQPEIELAMSVSAGDCHDMVGGHYFAVGNSHTVKVGEEIVFYTTKDGQLVTSGETVSCEGQEDKVEGELFSEILSLEQWRVKVEAVTLLATPHQRTLKVVQGNELLPAECKLEHPNCRAGDSTYIWTMDRSLGCAMRIVRKFVGEPGQQGGRMVIMDHHNKIRIELGPTRTYCGLNMFKTQYKSFYITQEQTNDDFKEINGFQVNLPLFVTSRDDYIAGATEDLFMTKTNHIGELLCQGEAAKQNHGPVATGIPGRFMLQNGEIDTRFTCLPVKVIPREGEEGCFEELPVYYGKQKMFLHSNTRILTRYATATFCDAATPAAFRTIGGRWIAATPNIVKLESPVDIPQSSFNFSQLRHEDLSSTVGLYSLRQSEAGFQALADWGLHQQVQRRIIHYVCHNINEPRCASKNQYLSLSAFTPANLIENSFHNLFSKFMHYLNELGLYTSIFVAIYLVLGLMRGVIAYLGNVHELYQIHGWNPQILKWSCPEILARKIYRKLYKKRREMPEDNIYVAYDPAPRYKDKNVTFNSTAKYKERKGSMDLKAYDHAFYKKMKDLSATLPRTRLDVDNLGSTLPKNRMEVNNSEINNMRVLNGALVCPWTSNLPTTPEGV